MTTKLRCYIGNLDGDREGLVIAPNQRLAAKIAGVSLYDFRNHWIEYTHHRTSEVTEELTLYTRWMYPLNSRWVKGRVRREGRGGT